MSGNQECLCQEFLPTNSFNEWIHTAIFITNLKMVSRPLDTLSGSQGIKWVWPVWTVCYFLHVFESIPASATSHLCGNKWLLLLESCLLKASLCLFMGFGDDTRKSFKTLKPTSKSGVKWKMHKRCQISTTSCSISPPFSKSLRLSYEYDTLSL